jgi:uncharacterized protein (DUF488 family)
MPKHTIIFTIGHSTHDIKTFKALLRAYGINQVIDVRTIPRSRHNPQFNQDIVSKSLRNSKINYRHIKALGGLRHAKKDSINTAWKNASFRGFADYMQTEAFKKGLDKLIDLAKHKRIVIMCSEAVPWRCHRSLIADALLIRGFEVHDIFTATKSTKHTLTPWAKVRNLTITYPSTK